MKPLLFDRPRGARGIVPLIAGAMGLGALRGVYGAVSGNQRKQRNKGFIDENYRIATGRLAIDQRRNRQLSAEDLNRRGLVGSGFGTIKQAMGVADPENAPHTLGEQQQSDLEGELAMETQDLEQQRERAHLENRAAGTNDLLGSLASGVSTGLSAYSAGKSLQDAPKPGTIAGAMRVPGAFGIDPIDPLGPGSAWHPANKTINGDGMANYDFNTARG